MKQTLVLLVTLFVISSLMIISQTKDFKQKHSEFNNPLFTNGAVLESPLSTLTESFESPLFPPTGWKKADPDAGTGWARITAGTTPLPGWQGGMLVVPNSTFGVATAYCTWTTGGAAHNDQWLITPQVTNVQANDSLYFWLWKYGGYNDQLNIKISLTLAVPDSMKITAGSYPRIVGDSGWVYYKIGIGNLVPAGSNIYIGFQEYVADNAVDGDFLALDLVRVTVGTATSVKTIGNVTPSKYELGQNYPNPFNPSTKINFALTTDSKVTIKVYNLIGQEVAMLLNGNMTAGNHSVNFNGSKLSSGVYFYKMDAKGSDGKSFSSIKKMILNK